MAQVQIDPQEKLAYINVFWLLLIAVVNRVNQSMILHCEIRNLYECNLYIEQLLWVHGYVL